MPRTVEGVVAGPETGGEGDTPQVIAVQGLLPWTVTKVRPRLWTTLEPGIVSPIQGLGWIQ